MSIEDVVVNAFAERLYSTWQQFRAEVLPDGIAHPRWFALADEHREPFIVAARSILDAEEVGK